MAKLKNPLASLRASGALGNALSFARRKAVNLVERKPVPPDARSESQGSWRTMFTACKDLWHTLSAAEKAAWESAATPRHMTGYAWYLSQCLRPNPGIYLPLAGGEMSGNIGMATHSIIGLPLPTGTGHATRKSYVDGIMTAHAALPDVHHAKTLASQGTYAGDDADNRAIPHGLGVTPKLVLIMCTDPGAQAGISGYCAGAEYFVSIGQAEVNAVQARNTTNFYVPNVPNIRLNKVGQTYAWAAVG